jgi:hypothetical protein
MKGRLNSKERKTCRAGGPPLRFVQRWGEMDSTLRIKSTQQLIGNILRIPGLRAGTHPSKTAKGGHPRMETESSFPELYFPRKVGHPPSQQTNPRSFPPCRMA